MATKSKTTKEPNKNKVHWSIPYPKLLVHYSEKQKLFTVKKVEHGELTLITTFPKVKLRVALKPLVLEHCDFDGINFAISINSHQYSNDNFDHMYKAIIRILKEKFVDNPISISIPKAQIQAIVNHAKQTTRNIETRNFNIAIDNLKSYL